MDKIKEWFNKAKVDDKISDREVDAVDQAKDLVGEFKDKFTRDDGDDSDDG